MKSLHLGDVAQFPFIEAPSGRAIADGYQLLSELGAVDDANELTPMGVELSKLPLDPRVGRMILEARERRALDEVLVIASALSVQDVRDRPLEAQQQADQAHAKFDDEKSEFSGYLKLWKWINEARGGAPSLPSARAQRPWRSRKRLRRPSCPWGSGPQRQRPQRLQRRRPHPRTSSAIASTKRCCGRTSSASAACASGATSIPSCSQW